MNPCIKFVMASLLAMLIALPVFAAPATAKKTGKFFKGTINRRALNDKAVTQRKIFEVDETLAQAAGAKRKVAVRGTKLADKGSKNATGARRYVSTSRSQVRAIEVVTIKAPAKAQRGKKR